MKAVTRGVMTIARGVVTVTNDMCDKDAINLLHMVLIDIHYTHNV